MAASPERFAPSNYPPPSAAKRPTVREAAGAQAGSGSRPRMAEIAAHSSSPRELPYACRSWVK